MKYEIALAGKDNPHHVKNLSDNEFPGVTLLHTRSTKFEHTGPVTNNDEPRQAKDFNKSDILTVAKSNVREEVPVCSQPLVDIDTPGHE